MYEASTAHLSEACHGEWEEGRQIAIAKAQCLGIRSQFSELKGVAQFLGGHGEEASKIRKAKGERRKTQRTEV